jgi:hypothetical protein
MSGFTDAAFAGAGALPGLELWRIEKGVPTKTEVSKSFVSRTLVFWQKRRLQTVLAALIFS